MKLTNADLCAIKVHHRTRDAAQAVIDGKPFKYAGCHAYLCPVCREGWLVGHVMTARVKRREEVTV